MEEACSSRSLRDQKTMSNNLRILPTHQTTSNHTMSTVNSQRISTVLTVISANIEGLTASNASMLSEMCKREHCHCLCLQKTHRAPHLARPKIPGMTLIAERPHIKYGIAILIRSDLKVKGVSVWEQDNVELISIEMPGVVVHSVYKPPNEKFVLPALGHGNLPHIVIGDFNSHSTTWGYTNTDDNGEAPTRAESRRMQASTSVPTVARRHMMSSISSFARLTRLQ